MTGDASTRAGSRAARASGAARTGPRVAALRGAGRARDLDLRGRVPPGTHRRALACRRGRGLPRRRLRQEELR